MCTDTATLGIYVPNFGIIEKIKRRIDGKLYAFVQFTSESERENYAELTNRQDTEQEKLLNELRGRLSKLQRIEELKSSAHSKSRLLYLELLNEIESVSALERQITEIQLNLSESKKGGKHLYIIPIGTFDNKNCRITIELNIQNPLDMQKICHLIFKRYAAKYHVLFKRY